MPRSLPQSPEDQLRQIIVAANIPAEMKEEVQTFLQLALDQYCYRRDANAAVPSRAKVRASLERLIVDTKKVLDAMEEHPWLRSGLEGTARIHEGLMYRAGSRGSQEMLAEAIYGIRWVQRAASEWLDYLASVDRKYLPPAKRRGSADEFLVGQLIWLWGDRLGRRITRSETSPLTTMIAGCFEAAGTRRTHPAIRKQIERHGKPRKSARKSARKSPRQPSN